MGNWFSSLWSSWFPNREYKLVMVGLDNAGKTTSLYQLSLGQAVVTGPTIGSNVEQVQFENLTFDIWDLGGQANLRPSWTTYYTHTDAIIVVVDSTDRVRIRTAKEELFKLLGNNTLSRAPVLIFANKQDLRAAMSVAELTDSLNLHSIKNHDWHIQGCCALTGEGLLDGVGWIAQKVNGGKALAQPPKQQNAAAAAAVQS